MGYILVFDVGTSSIKTSLFDERLRVLSRHNTELKILTKPGQVIEMDPQEYWLGLCQGVRSILYEYPKAKNNIRIISITTQGETMIPVDSKGNELSNAIVWLDSRSHKEANDLRKVFHSDSFYPVTGIPQIDATTPISKILNIKRNHQDVYQKVDKFLLLEDYLIFRLTGKFVTEKSLMSSTGYFDIKHDKIFTDILDFTNISKKLIPDILDCGQKVGKILSDVAATLGLNKEIKIFTGAMDQVAGALGAGNYNSEIITETTGTALVVCASTKKPDFKLPIKPHIYRHVEAKNYLVLSYCETAGLILKWFKDEFCEMESERFGSDVYAEMDRMASNARASAEGLFLLPQFSGRSVQDSELGKKGGFYGITLDTKKPNIIRAILEGISFSLRSNVEIIESMGIRASESISLGGGAKSPLWCQIKADILGKSVITLDQEESSSLGAAILGGVGFGVFEGIPSVGSINPPKKVYEPIAINVETYKKSYKTYNRLIEKFYCDESITYQGE